MAAKDGRAAQGVLHQALTEHNVWVDEKTHIWKLSGDLPSNHVCQRCAVASNVFRQLEWSAATGPRRGKNEAVAAGG